MRQMVLVVLSIFLGSTRVWGFTANRVWYELTPKGLFRVTVSYTVPALREFREVHTDFAKRQEAEQFYWKMVRGADFTLANAGQAAFVVPPLVPRPW